jgi:hypothetical protein
MKAKLDGKMAEKADIAVKTEAVGSRLEHETEAGRCTFTLSDPRFMR